MMGRNVQNTAERRLFHPMEPRANQFFSMDPLQLLARLHATGVWLVSTKNRSFVYYLRAIICAPGSGNWFPLVDAS